MLERAGRRYSTADRQACIDRDLADARRRRDETRGREQEKDARERQVRQAAAVASAAAAASAATKRGSGIGGPGGSFLGGDGGGFFGAGIEADPDRAVGGTAASRVRGLTPEELDRREDARARQQAHEAVVANTARDLRFCHRAVPTWRKGLVS
ncbi:unnamed protein product [Phaeothamnion confervicola]